MGEVYRAHDEKLDRDVAVKVLPEEVAEDEARLARFEREAKAVAQLSHPHICTLHDVGREGDVHFLVMEYLEGESLADRLKRGPLQFDQALHHAIEITGGLDAAHRRGVIHRDLKPGNIMLTRAGAKLLDFGLAKLAESESSMVAGELSALPTEAKPLTEDGAILGTLQYMAPEQLEGKEADACTDIFAFGAVVYEMLTGRRAFEGTSQASLIAAILEHEAPTVSNSVDLSPSALDWSVKKCLAKDPEDRWHSAHDLRDELERIAEREKEALPLSMTAGRQYHRLAWAIAFISALSTLTLLLLWPSSKEDAQILQVLLPEGHTQTLETAGPVISPDGRSMAIVSIDDTGQRRIWVRSLESVAFRSLPGTEDAMNAFWSPDGRFIGFFAGNEVKKVGVDGTPAETLCKDPLGLPRGGTWSRDGVILFARGNDTIYRVSATGGQPEALYERSEERGFRSLRWPSFLPDGRHFVFLSVQHAQDGLLGDHIFLGSLDSNEAVPLIEAPSNAVYAPPGYLLYARHGRLLAHAFDAKRLRFEGEPTPLAEGLENNIGLGHWGFSVSDTGVLSYSSGHTIRPTWFDRSGRNLGVIGEPTLACYDVRLSPDETIAAMTCVDPVVGASDIRILDLKRNASSRLTSDPVWDQWPVWSPLGERLAFWSETEFRQRFIDRPAERAVLLKTEQYHFKPTDWSPDGKFILFQTHERGAGSDLMVVTTDGSGKTEPVLSSHFSEIDGRFSPDGRLIAYASDESGRFEVYVQPLPVGDRRYQVSFEGGRKPYWRGDGNELFYVAGDRFLVAVPVQTSPTFQLGEEERLFRTMLPSLVESTFSVSNDGQRFLLFSSTSPSAMNVVLNWTALLER